MTDPAAPSPSPLQDWITIWHVEIRAMLTDREAQEAALRVVDLWAEQARAALDGALPAAGSDEPPGAAAAGAAPAPGGAAPAAGDDRDRLIAELRARIAELERGS